MTPPEIYRLNGEDGRWRVRVVPNKFPALQGYPQLDHTTQGKVFESMNGVGAHEVVIDSPEHTRDIPDLPLDQVEAIVDTYILRLKNLMATSAHRYVLLFKNHGKAAGASLAHPHSQIIATPLVPSEVQARLQSSKAHYKEHNRCLLCDLTAEELHVGERIIEEANGYVVVAPYASRFPFEMRISPRVHAHDFTTLSKDERQGLAQLLQRTLARLKSTIQHHPTNRAKPRHNGRAVVCTDSPGRLLPLANRDHPLLDHDGRVRVGKRRLHQPHPSRGGGPLPARD
jgi:UDPglucose--hexose-1-phosphate uridylyltransferase